MRDYIVPCITAVVVLFLVYCMFNTITSECEELGGKVMGVYNTLCVKDGLIINTD